MARATSRLSIEPDCSLAIHISWVFTASATLQCDSWRSNALDEVGDLRTKG